MTSHGIGTVAARQKSLQRRGCITHDRLLSATVVSLLQDRRVEVIEVEFSLKRDLVVGVENVEGERCLRSLEGCRVPADPQELAILLDPLSILRAHAKLHLETVDPVDIGDKNGMGPGGARQRAGGVLMTDVEAVVQVMEECPLKKFPIPDLIENEEASFEEG